MSHFDFTPYHRTTVGFDRLFELLENTSRATQNDNYPPFNIERLTENQYRISVAVAGFSDEELDITAQQNMLIVSGSRNVDGNDNRDFMHMGIANRNFERRFQLADHVHVTTADLSNGLLHIELLREVPDALKPRKIAIGATQSHTQVIEHQSDTEKNSASKKKSA